jgi:hypothetical protein
MRPILIPSLLAMAVAAHAADDTTPPLPQHPDGETAGGSDKSLHSWELPALTVQGHQPNGFRDDDRVGDYGQPRWSTVRRFAEVRTYVIPKGQAEFEYWLFISTPSKKDIDDAKSEGLPHPKAEVKQQYEFEMGLGYRLQLDLYQVYVKDGSDGNNNLDSTKFEMRYALADWGKIWGNPTLYGEWTQAASGPDSVEVKLLLCDDITSRWMWATNFVDEQKTGGLRDRSLEWNSAVAYDAIDGKLSLGAETNFANVSTLKVPGESARDHHWELLAGPSIRYYPIPQAHVILAEFIGLNNQANQSRTVLIGGWEF